MKPPIHFFLPAVLLAAVIVLPLRAQVVNDGAPNVLNNVTNTFTGDATVGTNESFTMLLLSDNAMLNSLAVDDVIGLFASLAPQITSVGLTTNHFLQITGLGEVNVIYGVDAASNLIAPIFWQRIGSNTPTAPDYSSSPTPTRPPLRSVSTARCFREPQTHL